MINRKSLTDTTNQNPINFGVFSEYLSIGEQIVCDIGNIPVKMLI